MKKTVGFKESVALLLLMLVILGTGVIHLGLAPNVPVLMVIGL